MDRAKRAAQEVSVGQRPTVSEARAVKAIEQARRDAESLRAVEATHRESLRE